MKIILKDKQEIEISRSNINYNAALEDEDKNTLVFTIENPKVTPEELVEMLTAENLSEVQIVSEVKSITKENLRYIGVSENISDAFYRIDIRLAA